MMTHLCTRVLTFCKYVYFCLFVCLFVCFSVVLVCICVLDVFIYVGYQTKITLFKLCFLQKSFLVYSSKNGWKDQQRKTQSVSGEVDSQQEA